MELISGVSKVLNGLGISPSSPLRARPNQWLSRKRGDRLLFSRYPNKWYSQFGEDAVLQAILPPGIGTYIDIGSGHPVAGSNTYALYEKGWTGILVDPIRTNIDLSQRLRPRDRCIQAACGQDSGKKITFYEFDVYEYSTTASERVDELEQMGHSLRSSYEVETCILNDLVKDISRDSLTVLSIDVEGGEMEVLKGNDWSAFLPTFIIIEEWESPLVKTTEVSIFLSNLGYVICAVAGFSSIYRRNAEVN